MKIGRRQRGSAYIFVILLIITITTVGLSLADLSMAYIKTQRRIEANIRAKNIFEAVLAQLDCANLNAPYTVPSTTTITVNGNSYSCTLTDGSATVANSIRVVATMSIGGYSYTKTGYISLVGNSPFSYAIAVNSDFSTVQAVIAGSGGANGSIFANGNISLLSLLTVVNGNADATGASNATLVTGSKRGGMRAIQFPSVQDSDYAAIATTTLSGDQTLTNYTFPAVAAGQPYPVVYVNGSLTFKGTITGIGTFYVKDGFNVNGAMSYADANSRLAVVARGNLSWTGFNVVGYMYAGGNMSTSGLLGNNVSGSMAAAGNVVFNRTTKVVLDPTVRDNPMEGWRLHLPVYWP